MKSERSIIKLIILASCFISTVVDNEAAFSETLDLKPNALLMKQGEYVLPVSLNCPQFNLDSFTVGGISPISKPNSDIRSNKVMELSFAPIAASDSGKLEVKLFLQWSAKESVLRKWVRFRLTGIGSPMLLKELILDNIKCDANGTELSSVQPQIQSPQSYPIFFKGFFAGIEFPISASRIEAKSAIIAHKPGWRIEPEKWYQSRKAVYGITLVGKEKAAFQKYIMQNSPGGDLKRFFIWDPWQSVPLACSEGDMLEQLKLINDNLCKPYGVEIDAFSVGSGWQNSKSIWEIDKTRFPEGWTNIRKAAEKMNCRLATWSSPSAKYTPWSLDNSWANQQGYETFGTNPSKTDEYLCLAGSRYYNRLNEQLADLFSRYGIAYAYFDGYWFECPAKDHGHEPGLLSAELTAENMVNIFQTLRKKNPNIWLEATCFGLDGNGSPWWLFYVNTLLGSYGSGDYAAGQIPSPVYRDSCISARDASNLQGQYYVMSPISQQEVFGGFFNNQNYKEYVMVNDMVMGLMRGNMLYMMAVNPKLMADYQWAALARTIQWARKNVSAFTHTEPLLPASWMNGNCPKLGDYSNVPYGVYGYAHWTTDGGLIALRNPWIAPQSYTIKLDSEYLSDQAKGLSAVSIYPEPRVYAVDLKRSDSLTVKLAPYELVVLDIQKRHGLKNIPKWDEQIGRHVKATVIKSQLKRIDSNDAKNTKVAAVEVALQAEVSVLPSNSELLILLDGDVNSPADPEVCQLQVNGKTVPMTPYVSAEKSVSCPVFCGHWRYLKAALELGKSSIDLKLITKNDCARIGIWVWSTKPSVGDPRKACDGPITLPSPEFLSLDSAALLELTEVAAIAKDRVL